MTGQGATGRGAEFAGLVEAARSGDRAALEALLAAAQPDVRRYARAACRTASDVDDAVQDALCILYRRVGTIRSAQAFAAWLMVVARRECLRLARRVGGSHTSVEDLGDDLRLSVRSVDDLRLDLAAAIQSLPPHYRDVVLLRDVEELTIDEMAQARGLTRDAVKARLHRARALMREYLKDCSMTDPSPFARSPFASGGLLEHLGRGVLGIAAIALAVEVAQTVAAWWATPVSLALGVGSFVAFRGCPVCWTIGLVETAWRVARRG